MKSNQEFTFDCLRLMLKPIARFCVRHSLTVRELLEAAKIALIEAAEEDMQTAKEKVNVSRLSVVTGIHRRDVMRLTQEAAEQAGEQPANLVTRIIGQWEQDKRFHSSAGKPKPLSDEEFKQLVYLISQDLNAGTVLFQLERLGIVEKTKAGLRLVKKALSLQDDARQGYLLMARDLNDLGAAVQENLGGGRELPHLHARTEYDNVFQTSVPIIQRWLLEEGQSFHERLRRFLSKHDKDVNPSRGGDAGTRVIVTTYSRIVEEAT